MHLHELNQFKIVMRVGRTHLEDELRGVGGHLLDIHPSLGAAHHDRPVAGAVHQDGEVGLAADVQGLGHHHLDMARARGQSTMRNNVE